MGHPPVPDLAADRSGSCSMFVDMGNLANKPSSRDDGLLARLPISTGMVPDKPGYQNSYQGELGGQLGVICVIKIIESIVVSTPHVVVICDNISALRRALIHP